MWISSYCVSFRFAWASLLGVDACLLGGDGGGGGGGGGRTGIATTR